MAGTCADWADAHARPRPISLGAAVAIFFFLRQQELGGGADAPAATAPAAPAATAPAPAPAPVASTGPVVITANEPAWIQVYERGGRTLFQGELATGQSYEVPGTAAAPLLRTGKPEAIRIAGRAALVQIDRLIHYAQQQAAARREEPQS